MNLINLLQLRGWGWGGCCILCFTHSQTSQRWIFYFTAWSPEWRTDYYTTSDSLPKLQSSLLMCIGMNYPFFHHWQLKHHKELFTLRVQFMSYCTSVSPSCYQVCARVMFIVNLSIVLTHQSKDCRITHRSYSQSSFYPSKYSLI